MKERKFHSLEGYGIPPDFEFAQDGVDSTTAPVPQNVMQTSSPYVIRIQNTHAATDESNVVIFNAYARIQFANTAGDHFGNSNNIRIFSAISGTTYTQMLYEAMNRPWVVGLTLISGTAAQIIQPCTVTEQNARGIIHTRPLVNVYDPYQNITTMIAQKMIYKIDGFTSITISTLSHAETVLMYLYPSFDTDVARTLAGEGINQQFGAPKVIKEQKVAIQLPNQGGY